MYNRVMKNIIIILLVLVVILGGGYFLKVKYSTQTTTVNVGTYQAVFLATGQVYFGKLEEGKRSATLRNVYYLEATTPLQSEDGTEAVPSPGKNIQLVKLGNELHGPEDEMFIERDKILFWENMKADSKVMEAIERYQKEGKAS